MRLSRRGVYLGLISGAAAVLAGGVAYATIPDSQGVIHGCYTPNPTGQLRVIDTDKGQTCKTGEQALSWNQTGPQGPSGAQGPSGPAGPPGTAGPTSLTRGFALGVPESPGVTVRHTVTANEAGLTIITAYFHLTDADGTTGGATTVECDLGVNGSGNGSFITVSDNGDGLGNSTTETNVRRQTLDAADEVFAVCFALPGSGGEGHVRVDLLLERVNS